MIICQGQLKQAIFYTRSTVHNSLVILEWQGNRHILQIEIIRFGSY